jgi:eukaryotic-like serine/threonine-protein kinase
LPDPFETRTADPTLDTVSLGTAAAAAPPGGAWRGTSLGRFLALDAVGAGGMGVVLAAYDPRLDRRVALKLLRPGRRSGETEGTARLRLQREAQVMARLAHPNVVTVYDVGEVDDRVYVAMEFVEGRTLRQWLQEKPRSWREVVQMFLGAGRGLAAANAAGVVHRDFKPDNVLVGADERPRVTDFGLASTSSRELPAPLDAAQAGAQLETADLRRPLTLDGALVGTPVYMAPEQHDSGAVDAQADQFAFCVALYEALYGERPFRSEGYVGLLVQVKEGLVRPPPRGATVPAWLRKVVLRGLRPRPHDRFPGMEPLLRALASESRRARSRIWGGAIALGAVMVAAAFWGGGYLKDQPAAKCRATAETIAGTWNEGRRMDLRQRYAATGKSASWPVIERKIDEFAAGWRSIYTAGCTRTHVNRILSSEVLDLRVQCLDGQRGTLEAFVRALAKASPEQLVVAAGASLPTVADCDLSGRPETKPRPADPRSRAQIDTIEEGIAEANAGLNLGALDRAAVAAERAIGEARKLRYEPLLASALLRMGIVEKQRGGYKAADKESGLDRGAKLLEEAYATADAGRDERTRLLAARELVEVSVHRGQYQPAELWGRLAEGLLARLGTPPAEAASLATSVGLISLFTSRVPEAKAAFRRAHAFAQKVVPADRRLLATTQASVCLHGDVAAEETACLRQALTFALAALGPGHPNLGPFYYNLAVSLRGEVGGHPEACELMRQALAVQAIRDATHPSMLRQATTFAGCLTEVGKIDEARRQFDRLVALGAKPSDNRALLYEYFGKFLMDHGDLGEAIRYLRLAIDDYRTALPPTADLALGPVFWLVLALVDQGLASQALLQLDAAIAACRRVRKVDQSWAHLHSYRAWVLQVHNRMETSLPALEEALRLHQRYGSVEAELGITFLGLGTGHLRRGNTDQAVAYLERARKARAQVLNLPVFRAHIALTLADALMRKTGSTERIRACGLAREAGDLYRTLANKERYREAAERWLGRHSCGPLVVGKGSADSSPK